MRILITGGAGFIGSHVVDELQRTGHEPVVVDNFSSGKRENLPDGVPVFEADITNAASLTSIFDESRPEAVCHLAAQVSVSRSVREPEFDARTNILGLINTLSEAARIGAKRFAFASSGGALYGDVDKPAGENHPCRPISPYGISKLAGEQYLEFFANRFDMQTVALRFSNVYGPRQDPHGEAGVVAIFCQTLLAGESVTINGDGKYIRDYVQVEDVARAAVQSLVADIEAPFTPYNVGTAIGTDVNQLAAALLPICSEIRSSRGHTDPINPPTHGPHRDGDLRSSVLCIDRLKNDLDWALQSSLESGLKKTAAWFADRR